MFRMIYNTSTSDYYIALYNLDKDGKMLTTPHVHSYRYLFRGASCSDEAIKIFPQEFSNKDIFDDDIMRKLTIREYFLLSAELTSHKMTLNKRTNEIVLLKQIKYVYKS